MRGSAPHVEWVSFAPVTTRRARYPKPNSCARMHSRRASTSRTRVRIQRQNCELRTNVGVFAVDVGSRARLGRRCRKMFSTFGAAFARAAFARAAFARGAFATQTLLKKADENVQNICRALSRERPARASAQRQLFVGPMPRPSWRSYRRTPKACSSAYLDVRRVRCRTGARPHSTLEIRARTGLHALVRYALTARESSKQVFSAMTTCMEVPSPSRTGTAASRRHPHRVRTRQRAVLHVHHVARCWRSALAGCQRLGRPAPGARSARTRAVSAALRPGHQNPISVRV